VTILASRQFAVETFGRLGLDALQVLRQAQQRAVERDQATLGGWAGAALFNRWLALISCELQRSLHDSASAMWGSHGSLQATLPAQAPLATAVLPFAGLVL